MSVTHVFYVFSIMLSNDLILDKFCMARTLILFPENSLLVYIGDNAEMHVFLIKNMGASRICQVLIYVWVVEQQYHLLVHT